MGASVTRVRNPGIEGPKRLPDDLSERGRNDVFIDLKDPRGKEEVYRLISTTDVLVEGFRPGVMERLLLGPADCRVVNSRLVYARVTGWGQTGPLAGSAGHDINYIALSGALHAIGEKGGPPSLPLNLIGDYGGGGAFLAIDVLAAILKVRATGTGTCVDISMLDGAARLMGTIYERYYRNEFKDERGVNIGNGGMPWYCVYRTKCGAYMAVGAIESKFYADFVEGLGLNIKTVPSRDCSENWDELRQIFADRFLTKTRDEWDIAFERFDACVTPVLSLAEAPTHPHNRDREVFIATTDGAYRSWITPRFSDLPVA